MAIISAAKDEEQTTRDDEPTQVTSLLRELRETREEARTSLIEAGTCARHLGRRLRRSGSQQRLQAVTSQPPPPSKPVTE